MGLFLIGLSPISAQIIFNNDTTICSTQPFNLAAISSTLDSLNTDDVYTGVQDIGFSFTFYGNTYTKLLVSSNGYVTFDTTNANGLSPWSINAAIPNPGTEPENAIMTPWHDSNPGVGGVIYYGSFGVAPNRTYIVTWCSVPMFSCTSLIATSQLFLHEGSNKIEMFIEDKPLCTTWNTGAGIQGLVDATSTNFDIVDDPNLAGNPPRNSPLQWTATNEGWEFLPNGPTAYTINQIPFQIPVSGPTTWYNAAGDSLGFGPYLAVNPVVTTTYYADMPNSCSGGSYSDSVTITINPSFNIQASSIPVSCLGNDGTITVSPDLLTTQPPWDIELLDANNFIVQSAVNVTTNSFIFTNLFAGTYIVRVYDSGGCSNQKIVVVSQSINPINLSVNTVDVSCYDGSDGEIGVWPQGGLLPYRFYIDSILNPNPFPYDSLFSNLSGGSYIITVLDDNDCMRRDTVNLGAPKSALQALAASKLVICHGSSAGEVVGSSVGGTSPYTYEWFDSGMSSIFINDTATGLIAGTYYLEVVDANGCDTFTTVSVLEPQTALSGSPQIFGVSCKGDSTGMIVGNAQGSWAPYTYIWKNALGTIIQTISGVSTRDTLKDLPVGTYTLELYDSQDCFESYTLTVGEPSVALVIDSVLVVETISCYGSLDGEAIFYVHGGMPSYSYIWDNGVSGPLATGLSSGYHSFSVTDDWGCEVVDSVFIFEHSEIQSSISMVQDVSCYGASDASVGISSVGGFGNYEYQWSFNNSYTYNTPSSLSNLPDGIYYVTTEDDLGCTVVDSFVIIEPQPLSMEAIELSWISCFGAADGLGFSVAQGGTYPYIFEWGGSMPILLGDTVTVLTPGVHTVVVTDARGCTASDTILIHEPPLLSIVITDSIIPYCNGVATGSLTSFSTGGTGTHSYTWTEGLQTISLFGEYDSILNNVLQGVYTVKVSDARGCMASATCDIDTITSTMFTIVIPSLSYPGGWGVSCYGSTDGELEALVSGGHSPYTYVWQNNSSTSNLATGFSSGYQSVLVSDTNGCSKTAGFTIAEPSQLVFNTLGSTAASCLGACDGSVELVISGGTSSYTLIATENTNGLVTTVPIVNSIGGGLCAGDYTISISDINSCSALLSAGGGDYQVISTGISTVSQVDLSGVVDVLCNGFSTGSAQVLSPVSLPGYTYSWESLNGTVVGSGVTANNLSSGTYILLAHYGLGLYPGCTTFDTVVITEPLAITSSGSILDVDCNGNSSGSVLVTAQGGVPPYTYDPSSLLSNLVAGSYSVTVTDSNSCLDNAIFTVTQPQVLSAGITQSGYVLTAASPVGGTAPFSYSWREQSNPLSLGSGLSYTVINYGIYYVLVTDGNSCIAESDTVNYKENPLAVLEESSVVALSIYPNPFREETTVDFGREVKQVSIRVVDVFGKLIEEYSITNTDKHILKRNNKASGIYFVEIEVEQQGTAIYKLIIE